MTKEEAIKKIKSLCHDCVEFPHCVNTDPDCFKTLEMAREILEQKPCGDGISRQEVLSYIERILNQGTGKKKSFQFIRKYIESLPSIQPKTDVLDKIKAEIKEESRFCPLTEGLERALEIIDKYKTESLEQQPTAKENLVVEDCISREFIEIVVNYPPADLCTYPEYKGKPYYSILYRGEDGRNHVGFGTYKIEMLSQWIKEYFMPSIQPKTGYWIEEPNCWTRCSCCGEHYPQTSIYDFIGSNYCPNCGAKMESEVKE